MKKINFISISIFILSATNNIFAQNHAIETGKKNYHKFSYSKAINNLENLRTQNTEAIRVLAESYYMSGNSEMAEQYYEAVVNTKDKVPSDYFRYASILRVNKKYAESEQWIAKYAETNSADSRVKEHMSSKGATEKLLVDNGHYSLTGLDINSTGEDFGPAYLGNKIVFTSTREKTTSVVRRWNGNGLPFLDVYESTIKENAATTPEQFRKDLNKKYHDGPATFSEDGKFMVCTRNNYKQRGDDMTDNLELFTAEYIDNKWKNEKPFQYNDKNYSNGQPSLSPDGNTLYYTSNMPGGYGGTDIYKCVKQKDGSWSKPENAGGTINTEGNEMFPFYHGDGILFFASDGHLGLGGLDIFMAKDQHDGFGKAVNLGAPMNTNKDDFSLIVSKDQTTGYMCSNRAGGKGDDDIYFFNVIKPFKFFKTIKGLAKDEKGNILSDVAITLIDEESMDVVTAITGDNGEYSFEVAGDRDFAIRGTKAQYSDYNKTVTSSTPDDVITEDLMLDRKQFLSLYGLVTERGSNIPLKNVKISLINSTNGKEEVLSTSESGDFIKGLEGYKVHDKVNFKIRIEKEGYLTKTVTYSNILDKEGQYNLSENLDMRLDKASVGEDLAKIISLKPIFFDLGKFNIRKDASTELEKIVKLMNDNPAMVVELGSHTDCRGTAASNALLSDKRAKSSAAYIKKRISNPERISGKGYGETKLKNGCACEGSVKSTCSEAEMQENRRTEFIIIKM